ncbi:MAG: tetratricopeptide repeat protein [Cytophagales bacterium]|nr:tetratricopeptide repeat protein [Cytophagales bacterium]MDW8383385.1 tetratricopeptide repeat protein [Flammeovirgaceae bacterium]
MKQFFFVALIALSVVVKLFAQEKGSLSKAQMYLEKSDLANAKREIDAVLNDPKQAEKGKVWFTKGQIYQAIAISDNPQVEALAPNALETAIKAYKKVEELEKPTSFYVQRLKENTVDPATLQYLPPIYVEFANALINKGAVLVEKENYMSAIENFEGAMLINPKLDTLMNLYIFQSAYQVQENEKLPQEIREKAIGKMVAAAQKLIAYQYKKEFIYQVMVNYYNEKQDYEKALAIAKTGLMLFPKDKYLNQQLINIFVKTEKLQEAIKELQKSLSSEPNNVDLLFTLGVLYEKAGDVAKSVESYQKCLNIDPNYYDALINTAVYYFNLGNSKIKERNNLFDAKGKPTDVAKVNKLDQEINEHFRQALPYLERAIQQKEEKDVVRTLAYIYQQLKMNDKYNAIKAKISDDDED